MVGLSKFSSPRTIDTMDDSTSIMSEAQSPDHHVCSSHDDDIDLDFALLRLDFEALEYDTTTHPSQLDRNETGYYAVDIPVPSPKKIKTPSKEDAKGKSSSKSERKKHHTTPASPGKKEKKKRDRNTTPKDTKNDGEATRRTTEKEISCRSTHTILSLNDMIVEGNPNNNQLNRNETTFAIVGFEGTEDCQRKSSPRRTKKTTKLRCHQTKTKTNNKNNSNHSSNSSRDIEKNVSTRSKKSLIDDDDDDDDDDHDDDDDMDCFTLVPNPDATLPPSSPTSPPALKNTHSTMIRNRQAAWGDDLVSDLSPSCRSRSKYTTANNTTTTNIHTPSC